MPKTPKPMPKPTQPTPQVKRAMTRSAATLKLAEAAAKLMGRAVGAGPLEVRWFDDGSGIEGIIAQLGDGTFLWIDFNGCLTLQQELFGGTLEMAQTSTWVQADYDSVWNAFRLRHALPVTATCFGDLSDEDQEEHGNEWEEICNNGMIVIVVPISK